MQRLILVSLVVLLTLFSVPLAAHADMAPAIALTKPGPLPVPAAGVKLCGLFSDNMVLQSGVKCPIWGAAKPGSTVDIAIADQKASAQAGKDGQWFTTIGPLQPGGPFDMTITDGSTVTIKNVAIGEVWVCSGQSNMEMNLENSIGAVAVRATPDYPLVRMFTVTKQASSTPNNEATGNSENLHGWVVVSPKNWILEMCAIGYFFGVDLHQRLNVPVGIINASSGGTPSESWTSPETVAADPAFAPIRAWWAEVAKGYPACLADWKQGIVQWQKDADEAKAAHRPIPWRPMPPLDTACAQAPSTLYNAMIHPLMPYGIKGVLWYQGEANAARAYQYRTLFPALIRDWRAHWGEGDFPFLFVQLAGWMDIRFLPAFPADDCWAELREAQTMTLKVPKTGMAVAVDLGDYADIHPKRKKEVGQRLTLAALKVAYGQDLVYSGPLYDSMKVENGKIRLKFTNIGGGLVTRGEEVQGFAIAGDNRRFAWAKAQIDGDSVLVWSDDVPDPVAVRYAWAGYPTCNLYNKESLPASPFRTDDWPGIGTRVDNPDTTIWRAPLNQAGPAPLPVPATGVKLPSLFSDNMVLQAGASCPIWGAAPPDSQVEIALTDHPRKTTAKVGPDGQWRANLGPLQVGENFEMTIKDGDATVTIHNVLVGEVWICSGQSNMGYNLGAVRGANAEMAVADHPFLRLFTLNRRGSRTPLNDVDGKWEVCTPNTVGQFSAVGYFFGRDLQGRLNVPVGMINASWGSTSAQAWTSPEVVATQPALRDEVGYWQDAAEKYADTLKAYTASLAKWEQDAKDAQAAGKPAPPKPGQPHDPLTDRGVPSNLYNGILRPLIPFAIKGVVWYQGESNGSGILYRDIFPNMIRDWRWHWGQGDFPFIFVQLPNFRSDSEVDNDKRIAYGGTWPELREAQTMALKLPNTGMAVSIDVGDPFDVHPKGGKDVIGHRLMLSALRVAYGQDVPFAGPLYESMKIEGGKAHVKFSHLFGGFFVAGACQGFTIAGADQKFVTANAWPENDNTVAVWSDAVPNPVAVRYGWGQCPTCSLYNKADLPASPFRTDDWPSPIRNRFYTGGWYGPLYESAKADGNKMHVRFFNVFTGLMFQGDEPLGFTIAGMDGQFVPAKTAVDSDDTVSVWSDTVPNPVSVRYCWAPNLVCNLCGKDGLPAVPFRTDNWPGPELKPVSDPLQGAAGPKYQSPTSLRPLRIELPNQKVPAGYSGPAYQAMAIEGDKIRIKFDKIGGGLMVKITSDGGMIYRDLELQGFSIAGEDHKFVWAKAKIDGDSVLVWSDAVKNPVAVRYAWSIVPPGNLFSKDGLPAYPFRTDQ